MVRLLRADVLSHDLDAYSHQRVASVVDGAQQHHQFVQVHELVKAVKNSNSRGYWRWRCF